LNQKVFRANQVVHFELPAQEALAAFFGLRTLIREAFEDFRRGNNPVHHAVALRMAYQKSDFIRRNIDVNVIASLVSFHRFQ
jgi:hypothetical protein